MTTGADENIEISVIVPVYQQWEQFEEFLISWAEQDATINAELICVDNEPGSAPVGIKLPPKAHIIDCEKPGAYAARNAGAVTARGNWLVFTDADCRPKPDWMSELAEGMATVPTSLVAGDISMILRSPANPWAVFDLIRGIPQRRYVSRGYATTANLAVPNRIFQRLGGFNTEALSGGDAEFCRRARKDGAGLQFVETAVVEHPARSNWDELRTKARRVKGGQLLQGSLRRRLYWLGRSCLPPVHELAYYLRTDYPAPMRLTACTVRLLLWGVELGEVFRLLILNRDPERR